MTAIAAGSITSRSIPIAATKGYGRAIMNAAEDWLRAAGIAKLQLLVRRENAKVRAFYQSIGYAEAADASSSPNGSTAASRRRDGDQRNSMTISDRVRVKNIHVLSDKHYRLNDDDVRIAARQRRMADAEARELFDRGHAATLLPYNLASRTVVLTRQFRLPAYRRRP